MAKYCGKCGARLNESTGMCPNCISKSATYKKEVSSTKIKYKSSLRFILTIVILLGIVIANAYFDIVDIPVINDLITRPRSEILDEYIYNDSIIGTFTESKAVDEASALRVANEIAEIYGLKDDGRELVANDVRKSADTVYYRYSQSYQGIPFYSSNIIVMTDDNGVITGASVSVPEIDFTGLSVTPVVTAQEIFSSIKEEFDTEQVAILTLLSSDQLVIYTDANTDQVFLAYEFPVQINGIDYDIITDVLTGDILTLCSTVYQYNAGNNTEILSANGDVLCDKTYFLDQNGTRYEQGEIDEETGYRLWLDAEGNEYFISSKVRNAQIYTSEMVEAGTMDGGLRYKLYTQESADNLISDVDQTPETAQLQDLSDQFIRFLDIYLNRNGYDGNGGKVYIVYDDGFNWGIESYSIGNKQHEDTVIKFGKNKTIDRAFADTFAHEYTHSMEKTISNMDYSGESGALMEAISDIFGELFEDYYNDGLLNNNCNWKSEYTEFASGCRNMKDPSDDGSVFAKYATAYRDKNWVDGDGKYANSTVISHMAYLLVTGEGEGVLSPEDLLHLIYETLYLIPQDCSFITFKHKLEDAAELLNFTEAQKKHMRNCFIETGLEQSVYHPDTKLTVWDKWHQRYDSYIIVIEGEQDNGETVQKSISVDVESPVELRLKEGTYTLTVIDNKKDGDAIVYSKDIVISSESKSDQLEFITNYEKTDSSTGKDVLEWNDHTYQLFDYSMTWTAAKTYCERLGGHLVTITSADEQQIIEELISTGGKIQYWLGAEITSGSPVWVTGEAFDYTNWDKIEPNRQRRSDGLVESYIHILTTENPAVSGSRKFAWNDMFYDNIYPGEENFFTLNNVGFICEWDYKWD